MKKYIPFFVAVCLLVFIGCGEKSGSTDTSTETNTETGTETASTEETPVIEEVPEEEVAEEETEEIRDGVIVRITEGLIDPYRVVLALNTAEKMAAEHDVLVYFDMRSIDVVMKGAPAATFAPFTDSDKQISKLNGMGVTIRACGPCLEANWLKPENLTTGVKVLDMSELSTFSQGRIFTMDY